jgi:hypothetical protein
METLCSLRRRPILNAKERAQCCGRQDRRPDPRGVKCNACSASLLGPVEWPVPIEDAVASTIVAVELVHLAVHLAVLLDRSASQAKARCARPQKLKGELYQGVEANGEVDWGTQILSLRPNNEVISIVYRLLQVSRTAFRSGPRRLANFGFFAF